MDNGTFERLCQENWQTMLSYARRRTPSSADAADVVSEVFVVAWRRRDEIPEDASAVPWLLGVARNVVLNQQRGLVRRSRLQSRLVEEAEHQAVPNTELSHRGDAVVQALRQLSPTDRELLTLMAWDGLSADEVAIAMGTNAAAVRVRLHRARSRLRRQLQKDAPAGSASANTIPKASTPLMTKE